MNKSFNRIASRTLVIFAVLSSLILCLQSRGLASTDGDSPAIDIYPSDSWPSWSPDSQKLVFQSNRNPSKGPAPTEVSSLYTVSATSGGALSQLLAYFDLTNPAWSPDGTRVAYQADTQIYVLQLNTGSFAKITSADRDGLDVAWTSDSSNLLFFSSRAGFDNDIYRATWNANPNVAGTHKRLVRLDGADYLPVASPNGRHIAFVHEEPGSSNPGVISGTDIMVANSDGTGATLVYRCPADILRLSWYPDSDSILVQEGSFDLVNNCNLLVVSASTHTATPLLFPAAHLINIGTDAVFSPDGKSIAFAASPPGAAGCYLYRCNIDGSNLVQLTND